MTFSADEVILKYADVRRDTSHSAVHNIIETPLKITYVTIPCEVVNEIG